MASQTPASFDDLTKVEPSNDTEEEDEPTVKLDPGQEIVASIRHIEREKSEYGNDLMHLTRLEDGQPVVMWSNATIRAALAEADAGPGDIVGIRKAEDTEEREDDDGETFEYNPYQVAVEDGGDD